MMRIVTRSLDGHRQAYLDQFRNILSDVNIQTEVKSGWCQVLSGKSPVLFLMVEEDMLGYAAACFFRSFFGRRSVGLLFRGREAVRGSALKHRLKRYLLSMLKTSQGVTTISIVPFHSVLHLETVADDWIDDPQLWDLHDLNMPDTLLSQEIKALAQGRRVLVALGMQNAGKGFGFLTDVWRTNGGIRKNWLFVTAGKVSGDMQDTASYFAQSGGVLVDRFVTDDEMRSLYGVSNAVWGVYSPDYDQASGIFGRAVQFGKPIILRRGSVVEAHAGTIGARSSSVTFGDVDAVATALDQALATSVADESPVSAMRARSRAVVFAGLGLSTTT